MRTTSHLGLAAILLLSSINLFAQNDEFAYAITDASKEGTSWNVLRKVDLKTGTYSSVLFDGTDTKNIPLDAVTKKELNLQSPALHNLLKDPFSTGVAAIALDKKRNRLFYTPMFVNQLRYVDLTTMKAYYITDQTIAKELSNGVDGAKTISRMVITPDGVGYGLSNDGENFIRFTTGKNPSILSLGKLVDDPSNNTISVHNSCSSFGGDIISDEEGSLYLFTGRNNVFKINPDTKVATYIGAVKGLPEEFLTSAVVVYENQLLLSSSVASGYYSVDVVTLNAKPYQVAESTYFTSDLANSNFLSTSRNRINPVKAIASASASKAIQIYPNPVLDHSNLNLQFNNTATGKFSIELSDLTGRKVLVKQITVTAKNTTQSMPLNIGSAKGVYMLRVIDAAQKSIVEQKIVVQ